MWNGTSPLKTNDQKVLLDHTGHESGHKEKYKFAEKTSVKKDPLYLFEMRKLSLKLVRVVKIERVEKMENSLRT